MIENSTLVIERTKEAIGHVVHPLLSLKISPSINRICVTWSIIMNQAINIGRRKVIGRSRLFTFEDWKNDIMAHVHGHCNIICVGAWYFCLCMDCLVFASLLQIISLDYLKIWWKEVPLWACVLCILHLQFNICDEIRVVSISIISIIIITIIIKIIN